LRFLGLCLGSALWSFATQVIRWMLRLGILLPKELGVRVLSVGNLQAGGAGKTPLVIQIAKEAVEKGLKVCILSRGYKGLWEKSGGVLLPGGAADPKECGDEPALLHEQVPAALIGVGADRVSSYDHVVREHGRPDLVILDDGFQHWRIHKDVEVVALTSSTPREVLFRDSKTALKFASLVVWTKGTHCPTPAPDVEIRLTLKRPADGKQRIWLVTGVGDALSVKHSATEAGYQVNRHLIFDDHAAYTLQDLEGFLAGSAKEKALLATTGKDWVKWKSLGFSSADLIVLEPEVTFIKGRERWNRVLWGS